jgi:hypothetical protein
VSALKVLHIGVYTSLPTESNSKLWITSPQRKYAYPASILKLPDFLGSTLVNVFRTDQFSIFLKLRRSAEFMGVALEYIKSSLAVQVKKPSQFCEGKFFWRLDSHSYELLVSLRVSIYHAEILAQYPTKINASLCTLSFRL